MHRLTPLALIIAFALIACAPVAPTPMPTFAVKDTPRPTITLAPTITPILLTSTPMPTATATAIRPTPTLPIPTLSPDQELQVKNASEPRSDLVKTFDPHWGVVAKKTDGSIGAIYNSETNKWINVAIVGNFVLSNERDGASAPSVISDTQRVNDYLTLVLSLGDYIEKHGKAVAGSVNDVLSTLRDNAKGWSNDNPFVIKGVQIRPDDQVSIVFRATNSGLSENRFQIKRVNDNQVVFKFAPSTDKVDLALQMTASVMYTMVSRWGNPETQTSIAFMIIGSIKPQKENNLNYQAPMIIR